MMKKTICKAMAVLLCVQTLVTGWDVDVQARETGDHIKISELPGTMTVEKAYDDSFLTLNGYVQEGVNDRSEYYHDYLEYNEEQKKAFVEAGGKAEDYKMQNTRYYYVANNEAEFCEALEIGTLKVIELNADVNLGYKYLEREGIDPGPVRQISDYSKGNVPISSPDLIRDGVSRIELCDRDGLTIFSRNGSTIYHCELAFDHCNDIVVRNIGIQGMNEWDDYEKGLANVQPGHHKRYDWDDICVYASTNIWIDHCTLGIAYDGSVDITDASTATLTWCEIGVPDERMLEEMHNTIDYMEELYQVGNGHQFYTALRDGGATKEQIFRYSLINDKVHAFSCSEAWFYLNIKDRVTMAYNYYRNSAQRVPSIRSGSAHMYNCWVDATEYRQIHAELSDSAIGKMKDEKDRVLSPIAYASSLGCSTLGLCRANHARGGATIGTDTCVFEGVINPITGSELAGGKSSTDLGYQEGAVNHNLIVNSSTQDYGESEAYIGSSWDNDGYNKFLDGEDYWTEGRPSYGKFLWAKWKTEAESLTVSDVEDFVAGEFYEKYYIGTEELGYDYQIVPLDQVKDTLSDYSGCGKVVLGDDGWLKTKYGTDDGETDTYRVTVDYRDGVTALQTSNKTASDAITLDTPTREGYTFDGWYVQAGSGDDYTEEKFTSGSTVSQDTYIYAKWTAKNYTVTLNLNGGSTSEPTTLTCAYDEDVSLLKYDSETVTKSGYKLEGWYADAALTEEVNVIDVKENTTVYAKWLKPCKVTLELNGGTTEEKVTYEYLEGTAFEFQFLNNESVTRDGYKLGGWYLDKELTKDASGAVVTADTTFYAKWNKIYSFQFKLNGGKTANTSLKYKFEFYEGDVVDVYSLLGMEDVKRTGYVFKGWYTDKGLTIKADKVEVKEDTLIYARWLKEGEEDIEPTPAPTPTPEATPGAVTLPENFGDMNADKVVDLEDVQVLLKAALKITELTDEQRAVADANADELIDLYDAQMALKKAIKIIK